MFFYLSFLPCKVIRDAFTELISIDLRNTDVLSINECIIENYIEIAKFSSKLWALCNIAVPRT